jgi:hypothetical protein
MKKLLGFVILFYMFGFVFGVVFADVTVRVYGYAFMNRITPLPQLPLNVIVHYRDHNDDSIGPRRGDIGTVYTINIGNVCTSNNGMYSCICTIPDSVLASSIYDRVISVQSQPWTSAIPVEQGCFCLAGSAAYVDGTTNYNINPNVTGSPSTYEDNTTIFICGKVVDSVDGTPLRAGVSLSYETTNPRDGTHYVFNKVLQCADDGCYSGFVRVSDIVNPIRVRVWSVGYGSSWFSFSRIFDYPDYDSYYGLCKYINGDTTFLVRTLVRR